MASSITTFRLFLICAAAGIFTAKYKFIDGIVQTKDKTI